MIKKNKFFIFLLLMILSSKTAFSEELNIIDNVNKENISIISDNLFNDFKSSKNNDSNFGNFIIIFDKNFQGIDLSLYNKKYILEQGFKNFFLPPNIIHISSEHNKSFAYTLYTQNNYTDIVKRFSSHMLLFHELSHLYYYNKKLGDNLIYEEAFCDINSILMIKFLYNITDEELLEIIKSLIDYRKLYTYYNSISEQILPFIYLDIVKNKRKFYNLESVMQYSLDKSQKFIFMKYPNFKGDLIDLNDFSNMIKEEKIDIYNLKEKELKLIIGE